MVQCSSNVDNKAINKLKLMEIQKDIQDIIDYSHKFAEKMLIEHKEYYPFGVVIDKKGELIPVGYKDNETDMPKSQKVIDELKKHFQTELDKQEIRAYGITYDVRVKLNDSEEKSDAILIDITHRDSTNLPKYYFTYSWTSEGELVFGESFGINR